MVAFKTPVVAKKPPLLIFQSQLLYQLSRQLKDLAEILPTGTAVAQ